MEGDGPVYGKAVPLNWALAGEDPLAVDRVATRLMGFRPEDIGYLHLLSQDQGAGEKEKIAFIGDSPQGIGRPFQPHRNYRRQMRWKQELEEAGDSRLILARKNETASPKEGEALGEENTD